MRKHLSLGLIATSAILSSGLAFAQNEAAPQAQSQVDSAGSVPTSQSAPVAPNEKPLQTAEEKKEQDKRILGVLPNYRTADGTKKFVPMDAKGKMRIAFKDSFDYPSFVIAGALSLMYQAENQNPSFGQGVEGYFHRYSTGVADQIIGNMLTEGVMPSLLREDPRYFRKVNGSFWSRLGYASTRTLVAKNDKGAPCVNLAEIMGNAIGAGISASYYPDGRTFGDTFQRMGTAIATDTVSNILKEFWPDIKRRYKRRHESTIAVAP
jgi:hypothetical protein